MCISTILYATLKLERMDTKVVRNDREMLYVGRAEGETLHSAFPGSVALLLVSIARI